MNNGYNPLTQIGTWFNNLLSPLNFNSGLTVPPPTAAMGQTSGGVGIQSAPPGYAPFANGNTNMPSSRQEANPLPQAAIPAPPSAGYSLGGRYAPKLPAPKTVPQTGSQRTQIGALPPTASPLSTGDQTVDYAFRSPLSPQSTQQYELGRDGGLMGNLAPSSEFNATDAYGQDAPKVVPRDAAMGSPAQDWIAAGYTYNVQAQQWELPGGGSRAKTGNEYWRTTGNFGQVTGKGKVLGQRFDSKQAYDTWFRRKKLNAKKEDGNGGGGMNQETYQTGFGTG